MSYIQIQCDDCQGVNQMNANDIPLGPVAGGYSGALVGEIAYTGGKGLRCRCGGCIEVIQYLWTYPSGMGDYQETKTFGGSILNTAVPTTAQIS